MQSEALCCQTLFFRNPGTHGETVGQLEAIIQAHSHSQADSHPLARKRGKCVSNRASLTVSKEFKGGMACVEGRGGFSNEQCLGVESCSLRSNSFSDIAK